MNKILQMLHLQQSLNDSTNGLGWENGKTKNGKIIDWKRCIYLECAELIESYPWKHWKNIDAKADYENIKIETVDIWHFIMSQALEAYKVKGLGSIESMAKEIDTLDVMKAFKAESKASQKDYYEQIAITEKLMKTLFCSEDIHALIVAFFEIAIEAELNLDTLYQLYVGKNILNSFRQDHGYKEGSYIKIWNGEEDNVCMQQILAAHSDITPEALYQALEEAYPKA